MIGHAEKVGSLRDQLDDLNSEITEQAEAVLEFLVGSIGARDRPRVILMVAMVATDLRRAADLVAQAGHLLDQAVEALREEPC
jgi:hypothetical protein